MKILPRQRPGEQASGRRFSETLRRIEDRAEEGPVTIGELAVLCGHQGESFFAIFLTLPFLQPVPLPGISNAIGIMLVIIGVFIALQRPPWIPQFIARVSVKPEFAVRICRAIEKLFGKVERLVKPRAQWIFARRWFRLTNAAVWVLTALLFSLPLPIPLSNLVPASVILLLALGILEEDLYVVLLAYLGGLVNLLFFAGMIALPALGWRALTG